MGLEKGLSAKKVLFRQHYLSGADIQDAAMAANVSRSTAQAWVKEPDLRAAIEAANQAALAALTTNLTLAATEAVATLRKLQQEAPAYVAVQASSAIMREFSRLRELSLKEQRLAELEATLASLVGDGVEWYDPSDESESEARRALN